MGWSFIPSLGADLKQVELTNPFSTLTGTYTIEKGIVQNNVLKMDRGQVRGNPVRHYQFA